MQIPATAAPAGQATVDKKIRRTRVKSAYRDALFRPLFQVVAALDDALASGGTSVTAPSGGETSITYATPSHPLYPVIHLAASTATAPAIASGTSYRIEALTDEEEIRVARFWRDYAVRLAGLPQHRLPAPWRDLSDVAAIEWFHSGMRSSGPYMAFTLNLSPEVEQQARSEPRAADWFSKRIARNLRAALGRKVEFWFGFELSEARRLHLHGELQIAGDEAKAARKALRLAGGEWVEVRQHQAKTKDAPSLPWAFYTAKEFNLIRPRTGRLGEVRRPINGDWLFATNAVRSHAAELYSAQRKRVLEFI